MVTSSNGNISALLALGVGNSPVTGEFPSQRPVTRGFDVVFDLHLNKRLSKQSRRCCLRRHRGHYDVTVMGMFAVWSGTTARHNPLIGRHGNKHRTLSNHYSCEATSVMLQKMFGPDNNDLIIVIDVLGAQSVSLTLVWLNLCRKSKKAFDYFSFPSLLKT